MAIGAGGAVSAGGGLDSLGWTWDVVAGRDGQMDPEKEPKKRFLEKHDPAQTLPIGGDQGLAQEGHGNAAAVPPVQAPWRLVALLRWRRSGMIGEGNVEPKVAWEPAANFGGKKPGRTPTPVRPMPSAWGSNGARTQRKEIRGFGSWSGKIN
jgi:hypothetical protein